MIKYITVQKEASAEQIIEKSKFIAYIKPVSSREEANLFFDSIRNLHKDATHNVPVLIMGDNQEVMWSSDDGEPGGTSGTPILQMLLKENITNAAVMVTRYFGGIKLGTGGLARAYSGTAKMALDAAGKREVREYKRLRVQMPYSAFQKLKNNSKEYACELCETMYNDQVQTTLEYDSDNDGAIREMLLNISLGNLKIIS